MNGGEFFLFALDGNVKKILKNVLYVFIFCRYNCILLYEHTFAITR